MGGGRQGSRFMSAVEKNKTARWHY